MRSTDPTGHVEVEDNGEVAPKDLDRDLVFRAYAQTLLVYAARGAMTDLEALARLSDFVAAGTSDKDSYLTAMSKIILGVDTIGPGGLWAAAQGADKNGCAGVGRDPKDCPGNALSWGDTGFHKDFQDGHNQLFHAWGYVSTTATGFLPLGMTLASGGNVVHELGQTALGGVEYAFGSALQGDNASTYLQREFGVYLESDAVNNKWRWWGTSWEDYNLAVAGEVLGAKINLGLVKPSEVGGYIRANWGTTGPGSYGMVGAQTSIYGPLPGSSIP